MNITRYFLKAFFSIVFQGAEKSAYPLTCSAQGDFQQTGGGDFVANLSFYIILANAVKILVWVICSEISRLGRTLFMIMDVLSACLKKEAYIWTVKERYKLGDDISSKVLAFAFGLSAEIERQLISERTKEALARLKSQGKILGRPKGSKNKNPNPKLDDEKILKMLKSGIKKKKIAKKIGVHENTLYKYLLKNNLKK